MTKVCYLYSKQFRILYIRVGSWLKKEWSPISREGNRNLIQVLKFFFHFHFGINEEKNVSVIFETPIRFWANIEILSFYKWHPVCVSIPIGILYPPTGISNFIVQYKSKHFLAEEINFNVEHVKHQGGGGTYRYVYLSQEVCSILYIYYVEIFKYYLFTLCSCYIFTLKHLVFFRHVLASQ